MENPEKLPATSRKRPTPPEDRQPPIAGQGPWPQELPEDYAQWLDGWMFDGDEQHQETEA